MNIIVNTVQLQSDTSQSSNDKNLVIKPKQCIDLLNVVKSEAIQRIVVKSLEGLEYNDIKQILIQSNRVLQNGSAVEIYNIGDSLDQEKLVSMSKVSGFGSLINRGDQNQIVFQKKSFKQRKLKLAAKKVQKEEDKNPWSKIQDSNVVDQNMSINQDDLLKNQADLAEFKKFAKESDCMTKAKPCENCTCGRAELQNGKKKLETGQVQSNCGKCYLGDAFRCASCPYRGLPAFQPGDQVKLNMGGEQQNIQAERVEATTTSSKDGKVMLNFD